MELAPFKWHGPSEQMHKKLTFRDIFLFGAFDQKENFNDLSSTVLVCRMPHRIWRETKQQSSRVKSSHQLSCCLCSFPFPVGHPAYKHNNLYGKYLNTSICIPNSKRGAKVDILLFAFCTQFPCIAPANARRHGWFWSILTSSLFWEWSKSVLINSVSDDSVVAGVLRQYMCHAKLPSLILRACLDTGVSSNAGTE